MTNDPLVEAVAAALQSDTKQPMDLHDLKDVLQRERLARVAIDTLRKLGALKEMSDERRKEAMLIADDIIDRQGYRSSIAGTQDIITLARYVLDLETQVSDIPDDGPCRDPKCPIAGEHDHGKMRRELMSGRGENPAVSRDG